MVRCVSTAEQAPRTQQQMVQLESKILKAVDFRVTLPTVHTYLNRYIRAGQVSASILDSVASLCVCDNESVFSVGNSCRSWQCASLDVYASAVS
jgi:hypothetical protein